MDRGYDSKLVRALCEAAGITDVICAQKSVPRNVLVIRTLRFFGIAEDAGRGVDPMHRHMALNLMVDEGGDEYGRGCYQQHR